MVTRRTFLFKLPMLISLFRFSSLPLLQNGGYVTRTPLTLENDFEFPLEFTVHSNNLKENPDYFVFLPMLLGNDK